MKPRLLLVDDEEMFLEYLSKRLISHNFQVTTCRSGEEALELISDADFDVAIIDVIMPGIDGIETLREIKKIRPLIEAIILTGRAFQEAGVEGLNLGAYDSLKKPCDPGHLVAIIKEAYKKKADHEERIRLIQLTQKLE